MIDARNITGTNTTVIESITTCPCPVFSRNVLAVSVLVPGYNWDIEQSGTRRVEVYICLFDECIMERLCVLSSHWFISEVLYVQC